MDYRQKPLKTTEFTLAVECCRWAFADGDPGQIETLARQVDWRRFTQIARRHRVQGLVWNCLRSLSISVPDDVSSFLSGEAAAIAERNLRAIRQSARLLEAFAGAGLPLIFVKGLTLGRLVYSEPLAKMSVDVDVLTAPDGASAAAAQLLGLGYRLVLPQGQPDSARLENWHRRRKESVWRSPDGVQLDLHTRLADSPDLLPGIGIGSPTRAVEVAPGVRLPTLALEPLFAYLCVHGASSAWFRLKWVTDLAGLLVSSTPDQIERLYERSVASGAGRSAAQALLLSDRIYATLRDSRLRAELARSPVNRWLADAAWSKLTSDSEPTDAFLGTATIHLTQFFLLPGAGFKQRELWRQASNALRGAS